MNLTVNQIVAKDKAGVKSAIVFLLFVFIFQASQSQVDTKFWFVAPEISNDHADRPIYFNITTFDEPAQVKISMPTNTSFPDINLTIAANSTHRENITSYIDIVENHYRTDYDPSIPGKNNNGILVESNVDITVYYESAAANNSDLFALKGRNALGSHFFTPFQNRYYNNSGSSWDEPAYSAFDVVFTEDNTYITLNIPDGKAVYNNGTGWTGTVRLGPFNRGETFSGIPVWMTNGIKPNKNANDVFGRVAQDHLSGLEIKAHDISGTHTKRIAVTIKDDSMRGFRGSAYDTGGDQIVPVEVIGKEYIALKGELRDGNVGNQYSKPPAPNWARQEAVFITATEDNTQITVRGNPETTIQKGDTYTLELEYDNTHILASAPVYVWQVTGFGDEMGSAILPAIDRCTGSQEVAFTRSQSGWDFYLTVLVRDGAEGGFLLNGAYNDVLKHSKFKKVTGTSFWRAATIGPVSNTDILELQQSVIENTIDLFHVGIIMGSGSGCRAGYFSDFGETPQITGAPLVDGLALCAGAMELSVDDGGTYASYQWYKNGEAIAGETTSSYLVDEPGRYNVTALTTCNGVTTETFPSNEIDAIPCISIDDIHITEGSPNAVFTIRITDPLAVDVQLEYETFNGTAIKTKDFQYSKGLATIHAGDDSCLVMVPVVQDAINEPDETFQLHIGDANAVNISDSVGICTIIDDGDAEPVLNLPSHLDCDENTPGGVINIPFSLSDESGYTVTADYIISEITATYGDDYSADQTGSISFAPGQKTKTIAIDIINDDIFEPSTEGYESFSVTFLNVQHAITGTDSAIVRINENDDEPAISVSNATSAEGDTLEFVFSTTRACSENITVNVEASDISAQQNTDYIYPAGIQTFTIEAGNTTRVLKIPVTNDLIAEGNEKFELSITNPVNAAIPFHPLTVTGNITDNSGFPQLFVDDLSVTEGDTALFMVYMSLSSSDDVTFNVQTAFNSATSGDFIPVTSPEQVIIVSGEKAVAVKIPTVQDTEEESNEIFTLTLSNVSGNVQFLDSIATATIIDDDESPVAQNDNYTVDEDPAAPLTGNVGNNDSGLGDAPVQFVIHTNVSNGNISLATNGTFEYIPNNDFHGSDGFDYIVTDADGDKDTARVIIQVNSVNDIPESYSDSYTVEEKTNPGYTDLTGNILNNDIGLGDTVSVVLITTPAKGKLTLEQDGSFTFIPEEQKYGNDGFTYRLKDNDNEESAITNVTISIEYFNDAAPVATDDHYSTPQNSSVEIEVLSNDSDIDGNSTIDKGSIQITNQPENGTLSLDVFSGKITYYPDPDYYGTDAFTYSVADLLIGSQPVKRSNEAMVEIEVTTNNNNPVAICKNIDAYVDENGTVTMFPDDIDDGSYDPDSDDTISLKINGNSELVFDCSSKGINTVTLTITDNHFAQSTCTSEIHVKDTINPAIETCPGDTLVYCGPAASGKTVIYQVPTFYDNCDGSSLIGNLVTGATSGSFFPVGSNAILYSYTDNSGNEPKTCEFTITVIKDTINPMISGLVNMEVTVDQPNNTYLHTGHSFDASATDNVKVNSITHDFESGGSTLNNSSFAVGNHVITWTATDIFGNDTTHTFALTVKPKFEVILATDKVGNEVCENEKIAFSAGQSGGTAPFEYMWYIDGNEVTAWTSEDSYESTTLKNGQSVHVRVKDSDGYQYESSAITTTVLPRPGSGSMFRQPNK